MGTKGPIFNLGPDPKGRVGRALCRNVATIARAHDVLVQIWPVCDSYARLLA
jgi:hypothetical protein